MKLLFFMFNTTTKRSLDVDAEYSNMDYFFWFRWMKHNARYVI